MRYLLAIDQGTSSSRAIVYDENCQPLATAQTEFPQYYPKPGWVEHDAEEIWQSVLVTAQAAIQKSGIKPTDLSAAGITNQRETVVVWDRKTGRPVHNAIVWQDRRTTEYLKALWQAGKEPLVQQKTGLILDPYFSASKMHWILDAIPNGRQRAEAGELAAGTIDSWLCWKLSEGKSHVIDVTNASRTLLMNLQTCAWDNELLSLFDIPQTLLPQIVSSNGRLAEISPSFFGSAIPITGILGDQQAALFGQLCTQPGMVKCTYGTGCFLLMFVGETPVASSNRLLSTVAWKFEDFPAQYALEGSVFIGGAAIQWLRDGLKIIPSASDINALAASVPDSDGVILVPAFSGLGAPYWDSGARGALLGLSRGTTSAHVARATLDGIAFQVTDLLSAMKKDSGRKLGLIRVDGGASASDLLMQIQSDLLGLTIERPKNTESTALGAAFAAGLGAGIWKDASEIAARREVEKVFRPTLDSKTRSAQLRRWRKAVKRTMNWTS